MNSAKPPLVDIQEEWGDGTNMLMFSVEATDAVGPITFRALDHHRVPFATVTKQIGKGKTIVRLGVKRDNAEMVQLVYGKFTDWRERSADNGFAFYYQPRKEQEELPGGGP